MEEYKVNGQDIVSNGTIGNNGVGGTNTGYTGANSNPIPNAGNTEVGGLPVKQGAWSKIKAFLFQEITVELTPKQKQFEDKMNEVLHQKITFESLHNFLYKEIKFGK